MSSPPPDEFFPERDTELKDILSVGLMVLGSAIFFGLMHQGRWDFEAILTLLGYGGGGLGLSLYVGIKWYRRRLGLRVTPVGLSEVFGSDRERLYEWSKVRRVVENA